MTRINKSLILALTCIFILIVTSSCNNAAKTSITVSNASSVDEYTEVIQKFEDLQKDIDVYRAKTGEIDKKYYAFSGEDNTYEILANDESKLSELQKDLENLQPQLDKIKETFTAYSNEVKNKYDMLVNAYEEYVDQLLDDLENLYQATTADYSLAEAPKGSTQAESLSWCFGWFNSSSNEQDATIIPEFKQYMENQKNGSEIND